MLKIILVICNVIFSLFSIKQNVFCYYYARELVPFAKLFDDIDSMCTFGYRNNTVFPFEWRMSKSQHYIEFKLYYTAISTHWCQYSLLCDCPERNIPEITHMDTHTNKKNMYRGRWFASCSCISKLTNWGRDKMAAILQATFSNRFSSMKIYEFSLRFP